MNTFVPHPSFRASARALDSKRLNKQVAECAQMLRVINKLAQGITTQVNRRGNTVKLAWSGHPAVKMWIGHDMAMFLYMGCCESERRRRGMKPHTEFDNITAQFPEYRVLSIADLCEFGAQGSAELPAWWNGPIHKSHQLVLEAKLRGVPQPEYKQFYVWPV